ncbi:zinc-binding dehydrogenase [Flagellimonas sp. CMM7]|uniref:zinc-binding dehydrogenase n=1 Tax=Flagellimonas sp. CMM7 TaxID=2654676 RepID=UPI0013D472AE|nr:zinc-binding dehydrogenase [Flagellimonas sp. CMM7]UII80341.1 zinc-binding dehydrogenase [Flagellimonas sp. CMM7]
MKAYILRDKNIALEDVAVPEIGDNDVLIKTKAFSLNPVDYKVTQGAFGLETPRIIGHDIAGEVAAIGKNVSHIAVGDRIFGMVNIFKTGAFAEYVVMHSAIVSRIPEGLSYKDAAAISCAGLTAWQAIDQKINLQPGQTVFITAGGGGVGGYAIQFAKLKGANVITTASKDFERIRNLGADFIINYKENAIANEVMRITKDGGVDYIINCISGKDIEQYASLLRYNGIIVGIAGIPKTYPYAPFTKAAGIIEVALGAVYTSGDTQQFQEIARTGEHIANLIKEGKIKTNSTQEITFEEIKEGLQWFSEGKSSGKIVVTK